MELVVETHCVDLKIIAQFANVHLNTAVMLMSFARETMFNNQLVAPLIKNAILVTSVNLAIASKAVDTMIIVLPTKLA